MSRGILAVTFALAGLACIQLAQGSIEGQGSTRKLLDTCGTANYGQCGGLNCPGPWQCADAAVGCCPSGYSCSRQSAWYWQCVPSDNAGTSGTVVAIPTPTPAATPAPTAAPLQNCGGLILSLYDQCGGENNCPSGVSCADSQWSVGCCPAGYGCTRSSQYYWQCLPKTSATLYKVYDQCGGQSNCPTGSSCSDSQWSGGSCSEGSLCTRANNWYWQCLPSISKGAVSVLGTAVTWPWYAYRFVDASAQWIWNSDNAASGDGAPVNSVPIKFAKLYNSAANASIEVTIHIIVDNYADVSLNSVSLGRVSGGWNGWFYPQLQGTIQPGENVLEVYAVNEGWQAGVLVSVTPSANAAQPTFLFHTDSTWTWQ